jgi:hypothetical protein
MNVEFLLNYKKENTQTSDEVFLNKVTNCNHLFSVTANKKSDATKDSYVVLAETLNNISVNATLKTTIHLTDNEKIISFECVLPKLGFKYFVPDQLEIITSKRKLLITFKKPYSFTYKYSGSSIELNIIVDAPFMHPAWDYSKGQRFSTALPLTQIGTQYSIEFDINSFEKNTSINLIKKFPYPSGYKAAFILTDHCDFDTVEKLQLFLYGNNNNGWLNRGLKISKGVFALGAKADEIKRSDSMEDEQYKALINQLYSDGSEIVHHALKHSGQLTSNEFHNTFNDFANTYQPKTWIDHGSYIKYCYSQGGKENPDFMLIESMKNKGYNNLWSFDDVNIDANQTLNILVDKKHFPTQLIKQFFKNLIQGKILVASHYFRTIIHRNYSKNIFIDFLMYAMASTKTIFINLQKKKGTFLKDCTSFIKTIFHFNRFRNKEHVPYTEKEVLQFALPLYLEERRPLTQYTEGDLLMFYTFETTHLTDIYTYQSLQQLINENGTHIGHTYILNNLPYINSIFLKKNNQLTLSDKWIDFLNLLEEKIKLQEVWNANMGEYADYNLSLLNITISYLANGTCTITNSNEYVVKDFTFISEKFATLSINDTVTKASSVDKNYHYYTLSLEPEQEYLIALI